MKSKSDLDSDTTMWMYRRYGMKSLAMKHLRGLVKCSGDATVELLTLQEELTACARVAKGSWVIRKGR